MSFPGRLVDLSVGRVFVHQRGAGPALVLVHGYLVSHHYFTPVLDELARHFTVTAFDLPGSGDSDAPSAERYQADPASVAGVVAELMEKLEIPSAHVIGHSMGGGIALALAARQPERVQRLVLEDAWAFPIRLPLLGRITLIPCLGPFLFMNVFSKADLRRHCRSVFHDHRVITDEYLDPYWQAFNRPGARRSAHQALQAFAHLDPRPSTPGSVRAPTLIVWGHDDGIIPRAHGDRLAREIPGARLAIVSQCGHAPHEEQPDRFLAEVIPFLKAREDATAAAP